MILTLTKCTRPSGVFSVEHGFALIGQPHFFQYGQQNDILSSPYHPSFNLIRHY